MDDKHAVDWFNRDNEDDKLLLAIIHIAEELGHLPTKEDIKPELVRRCVTYFNSFEQAMQKVATTLYGKPSLTSPDDLTSKERELSLDEQQKILLKRRETYRATLVELKKPGALGRIRNRWQEDYWQKRMYPPGMVVTQIPTRKPRDPIKQPSSPEDLSNLCSPSNFFAAEPKIKEKGSATAKPRGRPKGSRKRVLKEPLEEAERQKAASEAQFQQILDMISEKQLAEEDTASIASQMTQAADNDVEMIAETKPPVSEGSEVMSTEKTIPKEKDSMTPPEAESVATAHPASADSSLDQSKQTSAPPDPPPAPVETRRRKPHAARPRVKKEYALMSLWRVTQALQTFPVPPTQKQLVEYSRTHPEDKIPAQTTFRQLLGDKVTWERQLSEYAWEHGLTTEPPREDVYAPTENAADVAMEQAKPHTPSNDVSAPEGTASVVGKTAVKEVSADVLAAGEVTLKMSHDDELVLRIRLNGHPCRLTLNFD